MQPENFEGSDFKDLKTFINFEIFILKFNENQERGIVCM